MSEHAPQPSLNQLKAVQMDNGQTRYQDVMNGHRFVPESTFQEATKRASQILIDTVTELGDVSRDEVAAFSQELGLNDDYLKPHASVPGMKVLDRERLKNHDKFTSEDAENLQHNQRQAEYDELFAGKSDEDIDNEIRRNSHQKRVEEHNARHRAENEARGKRNAERIAETEQHNRIVDRYNTLVDERMARREEIITSTGLDKLSYSELGALLGEKPNYKVPKYEYVKRVQALQKELQASEALPYKEHIEVANGFIDMTTRTVKNSESTNQTIEAMRSFNKQALQAHIEKSAENNEASTTPLTKEQLLRQSIDLGTVFKSLKTAEERTEFIKNHSTELSNQLVLLMSKTEEGKSQLESLSVKEIENLFEPLREFMTTIFLDEKGQPLTKSEVENFLGTIYKEAVSERIFGNSAEADVAVQAEAVVAPEAVVPSVAIHELSKLYTSLATREEKIAFIEANRENLHDLVGSIMRANDAGELPLENLSPEEARDAYRLISGYLVVNHGADRESLTNFWNRLNGIVAPNSAGESANTATPVTHAEKPKGRLRNWAAKNKAAQAMARVGGKVAQKRKDTRSRRAGHTNGHGAVVAGTGAALANVAGAEVRGNVPKAVASRPERSTTQSTVEVTKSDAEQERLKNRRRGVAVTGAALLAGAASLIPLMDGDDAPKRVAPVETVEGVGNLPESSIPEAEAPATSEPRVNPDRLEPSETLTEQGIVSPFTDEELRETYTAEVAYRLDPAHAPELIQKGIDIYNFSNGTRFELGPRNGTTQIIEGTHTISPDEMQELNRMMVEYYAQTNSPAANNLPSAQ